MTVEEWTLTEVISERQIVLNLAASTPEINFPTSMSRYMRMGLFLTLNLPHPGSELKVKAAPCKQFSTKRVFPTELLPTTEIQ